MTLFQMLQQPLHNSCHHYPYFSGLPWQDLDVFQPCHSPLLITHNVLELPLLINDHQIWSFDLNLFVCPHAEVAKKVVIKIIANFQYTFQDLVIPYIIPFKPTFSPHNYPSALPRPHSCFLLHSFYAKFRHALTMWVMVPSFSLHILHFESVWDLSMIPLIKLVCISWSFVAKVSTSIFS